MGESCIFTGEVKASMKVPTRRWGNVAITRAMKEVVRLNESPHPKVGKSGRKIPERE